MGRHKNVWYMDNKNKTQAQHKNVWHMDNENKNDHPWVVKFTTQLLSCHAWTDLSLTRHGPVKARVELHGVGTIKCIDFIPSSKIS